MDEYNFTKVGDNLTIKGKYHNTLDIQGFSQMLKDPSYCYKFYWLEAIVAISKWYQAIGTIKCQPVAT